MQLAAPRLFVIDYAGVIGREPTERHWRNLARAADLPLQEFQRRYWHFRHEYDLGEPAHLYWSSVLGRPLEKNSEQARELVALDVIAWTVLDHEVLDILEEAREQPNRMSLLSNLPRELATAVRATAIATLFDHLVFSSEIVAAKPDPAAFGRVLALHNAQPQDAVFIDDRVENVTLAAALGLHAFTYSSPIRLREQLERWHSGRRLSGVF